MPLWIVVTGWTLILAAVNALVFVAGVIVGKRYPQDDGIPANGDHRDGTDPELAATQDRLRDDARRTWQPSTTQGDPE